MKIWIVGAQGTEKLKIAKLLEKEKEFKIGRLFTSLDESYKNTLYHADIYNFYSKDDVQSIFENDAYVFLNNMQGVQSDAAYDGLDLNEYDGNNVFVMSIGQFISINTKFISKDDLIVWCDGGRNWRMNNLAEDSNIREVKKYEQEEKSLRSTFFTSMIGFQSSLKNVIYFLEEDPARVKTIIKTIYNNPKLKAEFVKNFS